MAEGETVTQAAPAPEPTPNLPPAGSPERAQVLIAKHVAATEALQAKEREAEEPAAEEQEKPEEPAKGRVRGKDGKFVAGERGSTSPHKAGEPGATPGPATEKDKEAKPEVEEKPAHAGAGGIGKAQRLVREGKIADALQLIGLDPEKLTGEKWAAWRHENKRAAAELHEGRQGLERDRAELQTIARQAFEEMRPFVEAKAAVQAEDHDRAFQLIWGMSWDDFQRQQVRRMANPGAKEDPTVRQTREELAQLKRTLAQREQMDQQARAQHELAQRRQAKWNENASELSQSGDPRFEKASKQQLFMQEVWNVQAEHYDSRTDTTLPAVEAAEIAYERLQEEYGQWSEVFGGASAPSESRDRGAKTHAATGPGGNQVRRSAKSTSLNPSEAAEAAPPVKLKGKALLDYHVRKTAEALRNAG